MHKNTEPWRINQPVCLVSRVYIYTMYLLDTLLSKLKRKTHMKTVAQILTAIGILAIAAVMYLGITEAKTALKNQARHACAQDFRLEYFDQSTNTTIVKPIDDLYSKCLTEKGI